MAGREDLDRPSWNEGFPSLRRPQRTTIHRPAAFSFPHRGPERLFLLTPLMLEEHEALIGWSVAHSAQDRVSCLRPKPANTCGSAVDQSRRMLGYQSQGFENRTLAEGRVFHGIEYADPSTEALCN